MPDTTPLPERPREGCTENVDHWHDGEGTAHTCTRQLGRAILSAILTRRRPDEVRTMNAEFAELRRLLDCSSELPWECYRPHFASGSHSITASDGQTVAVEAGEFDAELIVAAVNALPALLNAAAERDALAAKVERLVAVHASYFDLDGRPGYDDTNPAPEDVWRFDRDFRAALDEEAQS